MIVVSNDGSKAPYKSLQVNQDILNHTMNATKAVEPFYNDQEYCLPGEPAEVSIPCFTLGSVADFLLPDNPKHREILPCFQQICKLLIGYKSQH